MENECKNEVSIFFKKINDRLSFENFDNAIMNLLNKTNEHIILKYIHPDSQQRENAMSCENIVSSAIQKIYTDKNIYNKLKKIKCNNKLLRTRILDSFNTKLFSKTGKEIIRLSDKLGILESEYDSNLQKHTIKISINNKKYDIGHDATYNNLMTGTKNRNLRKKIFLKKFAGIPENKPLIPKILKLRKRIAVLNGYTHWQEMMLGNSTIGTTTALFSMYHSVIKNVTDLCKKELELLAKVIKVPNIMHYDIAYAKDQYLRKKYHVDGYIIRPYLFLDNILDGVIELFEELFSVRMKRVDNTKFPFIPELIVLNVRTKEGYDGVVYLDLLYRQTKYKHAMCVNVKTMYNSDPEIKPSCMVVMSIPHDKYFSVKDLHVFIHEFGHAMHHILACNKDTFGAFSGSNNVIRDFIETPSQMLERIAFLPKYLGRILRHKHTGKKIPASIMKQIIDSDAEFRGLFYMRLMNTAFFDSLINSSKFESYEEVSSFCNDLESKIFGVRMEKLNLNYASMFTHFCGYSARYYTYLLNSAICTNFVEKIKTNIPKQIKRYIKYVLKPGSSVHSSQLISSFLGRSYSIHKFINAVKSHTDL